jgi:hypothetical protein
MKKILIFIISTLLLACAAPEVLKKQTTTGMPERLFPNTSSDKVKHALMDSCMGKRLTVEERGSNTVICSNTMEGGSAVLAQLAFGNAYSTTPTRNAVFLITKRGNDAFLVMNNYYIETIMPLGQVRREPINDNNAIKNQAQDWIDLIVVEPDPVLEPAQTKSKK